MEISLIEKLANYVIKIRKINPDISEEEMFKLLQDKEIEIILNYAKEISIKKLEEIKNEK